MAECIERANLIARIKYYVTHTPEGKGEHYAYSVMLNEVLNCPAADVAQWCMGGGMIPGDIRSRVEPQLSGAPTAAAH